MTLRPLHDLVQSRHDAGASGWLYRLTEARAYMHVLDSYSVESLDGLDRVRVFFEGAGSLEHTFAAPVSSQAIASWLQSRVRLEGGELLIGNAAPRILPRPKTFARRETLVCELKREPEPRSPGARPESQELVKPSQQTAPARGGLCDAALVALLANQFLTWEQLLQLTIFGAAFWIAGGWLKRASVVTAFAALLAMVAAELPSWVKTEFALILLVFSALVVAGIVVGGRVGGRRWIHTIFFTLLAMQPHQAPYWSTTGEKELYFSLVAFGVALGTLRLPVRQPSCLKNIREQLAIELI